MPLTKINAVVSRHIKYIEMLGVLMRIFSFSLVSWMGAESPFFFVWAFNTTDAFILSWCALIKKDKAYTLLNVFWVIVGIVGMLRASAVTLEGLKAGMAHGLSQLTALAS